MTWLLVALLLLIITAIAGPLVVCAVINALSEQEQRNLENSAPGGVLPPARAKRKKRWIK